MVTYDITGLYFTKHGTEERNQSCFFVITFQMLLEVKETGLVERLFFSGKKEGLKAIIYLTILSAFFFYSLWLSNDTLWGISFPCVLLATRLGTKRTEAAGRAWPAYECDGNSLLGVSFRGQFFITRWKEDAGWGQQLVFLLMCVWHHSPN